jgi:hypothetical protein
LRKLQGTINCSIFPVEDLDRLLKHRAADTPNRIRSKSLHIVLHAFIAVVSRPRDRALLVFTYHSINMSLNVALQSVAFYVLSCSTCAKINHRRKAKVQAKRERAEKHALETEQPGLYQHPSPFSTNPYWTEEIMMGPGPPKNKDKSGSKNASQRALNTAGQGSSYAGSTAMSSDPPSSPTAVTEGSRVSGEGWNRKRYQRED